MKKHVTWMALTVALVSLMPRSADAQGAGPSADATPLKVQIVLSRYQGEKRVSSMPYALSVNVLGNPHNSNDRPSGVGTLRMGSKIPIKMMIGPVVEGQKMPAAGPVMYQDVGTNIDCRTYALGDGRFAIEITVDDTSVYADESGKTPDQPSFRSFRATNSMILRDGQSGQFTSAVDKVSGEVTRVDVTLTVVK